MNASLFLDVHCELEIVRWLSIRRKYGGKKEIPVSQSCETERPKEVAHPGLLFILFLLRKNRLSNSRCGASASAEEPRSRLLSLRHFCFRSDRNFCDLRFLCILDVDGVQITEMAERKRFELLIRF